MRSHDRRWPHQSLISRTSSTTTIVRLLDPPAIMHDWWCNRCVDARPVVPLSKTCLQAIVTIWNRLTLLVQSPATSATSRALVLRIARDCKFLRSQLRRNLVGRENRCHWGLRHPIHFLNRIRLPSGVVRN